MSTISKFEGRKNTSLPMFRSRKQGRVLLVENDLDVCHKLELLLGSQGYDVFIAGNADKACSLSRFKGFAFILFHWLMEDEAGSEMCRQIRAVNKATPLFFYTSQNQENGLNGNLETQVQNCNVNYIDKNMVLKSIFLHLEKTRNKPSLTDKTF